MKLLVDANQRLDVHTNIKLANLIEPYDIFWYEEPVYADSIGQCAEVARRINIPNALLIEWQANRPAELWRG